MALINNGELNYAPDVSPNGLELFFTRFAAGFASLYRATRTSTTAAFSTVEPITSADGFVEGPSLTSDTKRLYYHKQTGSNTFAIYTVTRP
jgi:Tol biopolymer transport system component